MRVVHVNQTDNRGGAGRAAFRIHTALRNSGVELFMAVNEASSGGWSVDAPRGRLARATARIRPHLGLAVSRLQKSRAPGLHSPAIIPGGLRQRLAARGADIAHLHWVNAEMVSVAEIGRLGLPVVWTLHDMWPFCGAEHYTTADRWRTGYGPGSREDGGPLDLDAWVWRRKKRHWTRPMQIVTPSHWLAQCVAESDLMAGWPVTVIPNAIDTDIWCPVERTVARGILGLPQDRPIVMFGAMGGTEDPRKGGDLLFAALGKLALSGLDADLLIVGEVAPQAPPDLGFPVHYLGHLSDDVALRLAYAAADAFVLPSRLDNLPNTGVEALASGRPVIGFDTGGLPDIITHETNGYLARAFDVDDLARGIGWVLGLGEGWKRVSVAARTHAEETFAGDRIAGRYAALYASILGEAAT